MLPKSADKLIRKINSKKYRWQYELFLAEGPKVVSELLEAGLEPKFIIQDESSQFEFNGAHKVDPVRFQNLSKLEAANGVMGVFHFPDPPAKPGNACLVLDQVKDPGNLGTILRSGDWFGVSQVFCTEGTADIYNSKCVQSSMGSTARMKVTYGSSEDIFERLKDHRILVAEMEGVDYRTLDVANNKVALVMGNESNGPSSFFVENGETVSIPRSSDSQTESLNVAIATSVLLSRLSL